jgi:nicotinamide-nucleotide amidase
MGGISVRDNAENLAGEIGRLLKEKKATLSIAESCTGGLISHRITQIAGSSEYFLFSAVTYSNASKIKVLGVPPESLERFGAVHEEVAKQMAEGVRQVAGADYAISTSGIAGPDGGTPEKPVGTVCIGIATPHGAEGLRFCFPSESREINKERFAIAALEVLYNILLRDSL